MSTGLPTVRQSASRVDLDAVRDESAAVSKSPARACATIALLAIGFGCEGKGPTTASFLPGVASEDAPDVLSRTRPLMSTVFQIQVDSPPPNAENVMREAFEEIERLETVLSEWRDDSDISQVNRLAGKKPVKVSPDALRVVDAGMDVSAWSRGAFDLSWAALWGLYDFRPDSIKIPSSEEIKPRLSLINYENIRVSKKYKTVYLKKRGMAIGTGGIAKGYALDHAGAILRGAGIDNYMIFGGGQVQVHGKRDGRPWRVGIQHPRDTGSYFAALESTGASFSTSGDYENAAFDGAGRRWHHIIDTKTGLPGDKSLSVTIMTSEGIYADALSTAAFLLGPQRALQMLRRIAYPAEAVIVGADCKVYMSPKAKKQIRMNVELVDGRLPNCKP
ncbi:MAG: FAD:protein FMN transferase [Myxococcales bacterium]|nr:FAD:protein FMN transferase [Deltaproteobacteria bacterium]MBT8481957.1 FAD:protein FMN transferase [Deltaproteobacteria bacterium]NND29064.1 FAD:protein FMN transferase [Myxococcales bacterium]NNK41334.1 FAD:protein FMN transferase [Myxococcales bacterium]NNL24820.1 FAD:protein FMN transferase [Myxococcales bacterium]